MKKHIRNRKRCQNILSLSCTQIPLVVFRTNSFISSGRNSGTAGSISKLSRIFERHVFTSNLAKYFPATTKLASRQTASTTIGRKITDAIPGSLAVRNVRVRLYLILIFRQETIRVKFEWVGEIFFVVVHAVHVYGYVDTFRHVHAIWKGTSNVTISAKCVGLWSLLKTCQELIIYYYLILGAHTRAVR